MDHLKNAISLLKSNKDGLRCPKKWRSQYPTNVLATLDLPEVNGGLGLPLQEMIKVFRIAGEIDLTLRDAIGIGHASLLLEQSRGAESFADYLREVGGGNYFIGIAMTEPSAGSDIRSLETVGKNEHGQVVINGRKKYILRLMEATHFIVLFKCENTSSLSLAILPRDSEGISYKNIPKSAFPLQTFGEISFNNVKVGEQSLIGSWGGGMPIIVNHLTKWRILTTAALLGCASGALSLAIEWMRTREAFGGPIGRFSHLQQDVASYAGRIHMIWIFLSEIARSIDSGNEKYLESALCKAEGGDLAVQVVRWSVKTLGARGICEETDLMQRLLDLEAMTIADGASDLLRMQAARGLTGEEIYESGLSRSRTVNRVGGKALNYMLFPDAIDEY
ncbi:MAG: acyl-CoA dehydrogenase family protein [Luteolibacter sp.]|uniref:acyl-CoA dehydrogenase family protein n=1 Tax=Luteolibacter sp. TaxID=1962973 RepID=UPI003267AF39